MPQFLRNVVGKNIKIAECCQKLNIYLEKITNVRTFLFFITFKYHNDHLV